MEVIDFIPLWIMSSSFPITLPGLKWGNWQSWYVLDGGIFSMYLLPELTLFGTLANIGRE